ncbi:MFS transporter [Pseudonocardia humida]|uniref:MFS transporter n=1 Tax=Pseudonocardia humida TaxID=2800819 RepID=A0ABT1A7Q2_9PSEU|nr:MFS transporter [Pseudonocardia humida]MCO1659034.1 MFS transporter [Pseudonocardia humida]
MNVSARILIAVASLASLPVAMRPLLIVLLGEHNTGSYAAAGTASGAAALGFAGTAAAWARALPRFGDARVLLVAAAAASAAGAALAATTEPTAFVLMAGLCGVVTPPVTSSVRAMLPTLLPPDALTRGYAANAVGQEVVYVAGPLWVTAWSALSGPRAALLASVLTGAAALALVAALVPRSRPDAPANAPGRSPLAASGVRVLGAVYLAYWVCMGAMWVLVPAFAAHSGYPEQAGLLVTVWSVGSLAGGLLLAARRRSVRLPVAYPALLAVLFATSLPLVLPTVPAQMAVAIGIFGMGLAPWLAVSDELVGHAAPAGRAGEAYGWLASIGQLGGAVGSAVAGQLADRHGGGPAFLVVSAALGVGLAVALLGRRALPAGPPDRVR